MFLSIKSECEIEKKVGSRTDKEATMFPPSIPLTNSEIVALRADLHDAIQVAQKRWCKVHTTQPLHPKI